jgi:hypothetical protein
MLSQHGTERRRERAHTRSGAMFLLLDSLVDTGSIQGVVLANDAGFLLASTRGRFDAERAAACGIAFAKGDGDPVVDGLPGEIFVHALTVNMSTYYLISVGGRVTRVREVGAALRRILDIPRSHAAKA